MPHAMAAPLPVAAAAPRKARKQQPTTLQAVRLDGPPPPPPPPPPPAQHGASIATVNLRQRRAFICSLVAAGLGVAGVHDGEANAAARRPPPPPPTEKKDPNLSGVQAKVVASKRRKEAMKGAMAKMRERGKPVEEKPGGGTPQ